MPRRPRTLIPLCLALALAACAGLPPQPPQPPVPASVALADMRLGAWWQGFGDAQLAALLRQALQANTDVRLAQASLQQARALRDVAAAGLLPGLSGSAAAQRSDSGSSSPVNSFKLGLDASWEPDLFGGQRSAVQAQQATAEASAASLGDVQVAVAAEVALAYISLRGNQARLAIAEANLASQLETLQITEWRLQAGLTTSLEAEQARAAAEQTRAQLPALQTGIAQSRHALALLSGQPPAALDAQLAASAPLPQPGQDLALSIPAETLRQRPDVRAAELRVQAAAARVGEAEAARLPSLRIGGNVGLSALSLGTLTNGASLASALLASVSLPLFDGGAARAQVRAQQAALAQAQAAYQATVLGALRDVEDALVALRGDRERLARLQAASASAARAALLARQRHGSGLVDFQTVLETQRNQLSTEDGVATAMAAVSADHVRLYKALGGGWQPSS